MLDKIIIIFILTLLIGMFLNPNDKKQVIETEETGTSQSIDQLDKAESKSTSKSLLAIIIEIIAALFIPVAIFQVIVDHGWIRTHSNESDNIPPFP